MSMSMSSPGLGIGLGAGPSPGPRARDRRMDSNFSQPSRQLFVGNINFIGQNPDLERIFASFGPLESINYFSHLRFAFVIYYDVASAIRAREHCAEAPPFLCGRKLIVNYGKPMGATTPAGGDGSASSSSGSTQARWSDEARTAQKIANMRIMTHFQDSDNVFVGVEHWR